MLYKYFRDITKNHENRYRMIPTRRSKSSSNSAAQEQWGRQICTWRPICFSWAFRVPVITALCCLSSSVVDLSTTAATQLWPARAESSRVELSVQTSTALVLHTHTIKRHILVSQHWTIHVIHFIKWLQKVKWKFNKWQYVLEFTFLLKATWTVSEPPERSRYRTNALHVQWLCEVILFVQ